ncbi:hypothetical protein COL93_29210 [Bacillus toyonensis]|uniref:Uncharacterized protein n=1 Tax=Bacillus toyonensis TaxID=155322 RepID=A0A2B5WWG6_9BACI|nr:hypothetical protein COL93_29210 [Bacillus toyonensis]PHD61228.1 hypothetical protein COF40_26680 [Bacillus toyonensis]
MICEEIQKKGSGENLIHQYELNFSVMYSGKVTDSQSTIIPAQSLEEANEKLQSEVKRRLGKWVSFPIPSKRGNSKKISNKTFINKGF